MPCKAGVVEEAPFLGGFDDGGSFLAIVRLE